MKYPSPDLVQQGDSEMILMSQCADLGVEKHPWKFYSHHWSR